MAKTPDYTQLARDYMTLMQQRMTGAMTQPEFIESMLAAFAAMGPSPKKAANARAKRHTTAASQSHDDAIIRLERRVAKLEHALAKLGNATKPVPSRSSKSNAGMGGSAKPASTGSKKRAVGTKKGKATPKRRGR